MVVILLLTPPYEQHGCDGTKPDANADATAPQQTSTIPQTPPPPPAATATPAAATTGSFNSKYTNGQYENFSYSSAAYNNNSNNSSTNNNAPQQSSHINSSSNNTNTAKRFTQTFKRPRLRHKPNPYGLETIPQSPPSSADSNGSGSPKQEQQQHHTNGSTPKAPPLPKTPPPYEAYYTQWRPQHANIVPKPPRQHQQQQQQHLHQQANSFLSIGTPIYTNNSYTTNSNPYTTTASACTTTTTSDFVRHVTRVNFYDVDTSQVEYIPKDDDDDDEEVNIEGANDDACDTEAITKEEEWITKRKTELTTTRQIETRVKRQVLLEDGKVVEDSGPIVSTNTTEDTDKQETETTEKRDLGIPVDNALNTTDAVKPLEQPPAIAGGDGKQISEFGNGGKAVKKFVPRPADGLVRQTNEKRVISHEEIKDYTETEDVKHLGDFSDEAYVKAVSSGVENLEEVLLSEENQKQLVPLGPRLVANTSKSRKIIDSEDSEKRCLAQEDGKIVTEHKKTTEHEVIVDEELPDKDDLSTGSREKVTTKEANQRFYKQRDEQHVDRLVDGKVISTEMRYAADSMQMEKDGSLERPGDWDSLSDRMRKLRRTNQKTLLQQQKAALLAERKDALTKRPLDFDREEETRKGETMKWLESHFGSESTASNDSRDADDGADAIVEPTKKTFFNVTIKSNLGQTAQAPVMGAVRDSRVSTTATAATDSYDRKYHSQVVTNNNNSSSNTASNSRSKYYQGITNWSERKDQLPSKHFASKAFREDLQDTIERNRLRKTSANGPAVYSSRDKLNSMERDRDRERERYVPSEHPSKLVGPAIPSAAVNNDTYVSRDDIIHQKRRQSLSSQFLAKTRRSSSRDKLDDLHEIEPPMGPLATPTPPPPLQVKGHREPLINGSYTDLRYGQKVKQEESQRIIYNAGAKSGPHPQRSEFIDGRAKSFERDLDLDLDRDDHQMGGRRCYDVPKGYQTLKPSVRTAGSDSDHLPPMNGGSSTLGRPTVPQRRRAIEKKLRQQSSLTPPLPPQPLRKGSYEQQHRDFSEPPPDYSPPPRSRSSSPQVDYNQQRRRRSHSRERSMNDLDSQGPMQTTASTTTTLQRKQQQRTRFAPEPPSSNYHHQRPMMATQTTQTTPSTISGASTTQKTHSKMGQAIGNSIRKLVSKIRSASAERKMRLKRSKSREQSPSPPHVGGNATSSTTYQQYNVIDGHIGGGGNTESEQESLGGVEHAMPKMHGPNGYNNASKTSSGFRRSDSADPFIPLKDSSDGGVVSPRQRYYLGEDPYSSRLYGKENMYNPNGVAHRPGYGPQRPNQREQNEDAYNQQRYTSSSTLGRFQKSGGQRGVAASTPNLHQDYYRTAQTLPRKLHESQQTNGNRVNTTSTMITQRYTANGNGSQTLGHPDRRGQYQTATQMPLGPAKPARTYQKVLNRSKSFNVHAMNGGNDPSPIYIEKLTKNNYTTTTNLHNSQAYKSNPHLFSGGGYRDRVDRERERDRERDNSLQSGLKSPSIVNLISRSQRDLTKIGSTHEDEQDGGYDGHRPTHSATPPDDKKQTFLRGLHQQAPDLYRTLHGDEYREKPVPIRQQLQPKYSLDSRSPIEINKDTASIIRRDSAGGHEDYVPYQYGRPNEGGGAIMSNNRRLLMYKDEQRRRGSGSTIIELRNA